MSFSTTRIPASRDRLWFSASWIALLVTSLAVFVFGLIVVIVPGAPEPFYRSIGVASIGMGLFGAMITLTAFRARRPWAWFTLWYYPIFWATHLVADLPPGKDHIHQIAFIGLSLIGLLLPVRDFFHGGSASR
jgi:hypothetical protein